MLTLDCLSWEALQQKLDQLTGMGAIVDADLAGAEMRELAEQVLADPRRVALVQANCPDMHKQMVQRAGALARQIPDPAHGSATLEVWLRAQIDETLTAIGKAVKSEQVRRKAKPSKKR